MSLARAVRISGCGGQEGRHLTKEQEKGARGQAPKRLHERLRGARVRCAVPRSCHGERDSACSSYGVVKFAGTGTLAVAWWLSTFGCTVLVVLDIFGCLSDFFNSFPGLLL